MKPIPLGGGRLHAGRVHACPEVRGEIGAHRGAVSGKAGSPPRSPSHRRSPGATRPLRSAPGPHAADHGSMPPANAGRSRGTTPRGRRGRRLRGARRTPRAGARRRRNAPPPRGRRRCAPRPPRSRRRGRNVRVVAVADSHPVHRQAPQRPVRRRPRAIPSSRGAAEPDPPAAGFALTRSSAPRETALPPGGPLRGPEPSSVPRGIAAPRRGRRGSSP